MICKDCKNEMKIKWEELFGRLWVCEGCFAWISEPFGKELKSGVDMESANFQPEEGDKIA